MKHLNIGHTLPFVAFLALLISCGSDPAQVSNPISITSPGSGTTWNHYQTGVEIEWTGGNSDNLLIELLKGDASVEALAPAAPNTGSYLLPDCVRPCIGTGNDYSIRITDEIGESGTSSMFSVAEGSNSITVTEPGPSTGWEIGQINTHVEWENSSGAQVRIEIWKGGEYLDSYCGWTANSGSYTRSSPIPAEWGTGSGYSLTVIDDHDNYGFSGEFSLSDLLPSGMAFVTIPAGSFEMGAPVGEQGSYSNERPVHTVTFNYSFEMMTTEVTQAMWLDVMGSNPSHFTGDPNLPVERVSWYDCQDFIAEMNSLDPGHIYRLPSEAEWEYAARAGTTTRFYWGDDPGETQINTYAWWSGNSENTTHPVGQKLPNAWGLYDMSGNVWEWVQDWYHSDYVGAPDDGSAWEDPPGSYRVRRGGSRGNGARSCRSAHRLRYNPGGRSSYLGFRLARSVR